MSIELVEVQGNPPLPRFGHTVTYIGDNKVIMFGGATGNTGQFSITDTTYMFDIATSIWKKVQTTGTIPSPRAAHAAALVEKGSIVIYGGATSQGALASDDLFLLDVKDNYGVWNTTAVAGRTPGRRYGHTLTYFKPFLIVFAGNTGDREVNDCWVLNIQKMPLSWTEVVINNPNQVPSARVYHSASLCTEGKAGGMIVIFGGRGADKNALNDTWGFRRRRTGAWDWVKAPCKAEPAARHQHTSLFLGPLMLVIGGRANNVAQPLSLQVYDTQANEWNSFPTSQRFRHSSWLVDKSLYIYGGFELSSPNIPNDSIIKLNLVHLIRENVVTRTRVAALQTGNTSINNNPSNVTVGGTMQIEAPRPITPSSPILGGAGSSNISTRTASVRSNYSQLSHSDNSQSSIIVSNSAQSSRLRLLQPIIGRGPETASHLAASNLIHPLNNKNLNNKNDIALFFLNRLCQPQSYRNVEETNFPFRTQQVCALCDVVEQIIMSQPMVLKVRAPLKIFGDIHGQYSDLMSFFALYGCPHQNGKKKDIQSFDYIFLGDFVDRGSHSLETICLLFALKAVYPDQIHLIRGNHEDIQTNSSFGFKDQCADKCNEDPLDENSAFMRINRVFDCLPLAAVAEDKILCIHGGIGSTVNNIESIAALKRPLDIVHEVSNEEQQLVLDILWSDPTESDAELGIYCNTMRDPYGTGNIVKFGPDRVQDFLKKNNLSMIIRAHECVMDGFERFAGGSLITVFSATDYCKRHKNAGAILIVKTNLQIVPKLIYPSNQNANNWIQDEEQLKKRPPTPPRWKNMGGRGPGY